MSLSSSNKLTRTLAIALFSITAAASLAARAHADGAEVANQADTAVSDEQPKGTAKGDPSRGFNFTDLHYTGSPLGGPEAKAPAPGEEPEGVPAPFLYLVGNFVLLLLILAWKAAPAARKSAEKRHDDIKKALDEAASLRAQAKAKLDEYDQKLAAAEKEIAAMVEGMRADAEADKKRIIAAAEAQAAALKKDAEERIAAEILRARTLLAREVAAAASSAAETIIREKATAQDQNKLVDGFIADIKSSASTGTPAAKERV